jgi:hypothetical protein
MLMKKELNRLIVLVTNRVRENNMKTYFKISILMTLALLIALPFLSIKPAEAWSSVNVPVTIGTTRQYAPYESKPTARNITGSPDIRSPLSNGVYDPDTSMPALITPSFAYDADNTTSADIGFPATAETGYFEVAWAASSKDSTPGLTITSVDVFVTYSWDNTGTDVSDTYSLLIYSGATGVDPTLQSNTVLLAATNDAHGLATDVYTNVVDPVSGTTAWAWNDIGTLAFAVGVTYGGVSAAVPDFFLNEVWIRVNLNKAGQPVTPTAHPLTMATDGSIITYAQVEGFYYFTGALHLARFAQPAAAGRYAIKWVDLKMAYTFPADARGATTYSIQAVVNNSATVTLVAATSAAGPVTLGNTLAQTFQNLTNPKTGTKSWTWPDINWLDLKIVFSSTGITPPAYQIYDAWLTIYPVLEQDSTTVPYPLAGTTVSLQPDVMMNNTVAPGNYLRKNDYIFYDVYVFKAPKLFGYQFNITFSPTVLTYAAISPGNNFTYHPYNTAAPLSYSNAKGWVSLSFYTYAGDTTGVDYTGPICRLYFKVVWAGPGQGSTQLHFVQSIIANPGAQIPATTYDGYFNQSPPPIPEFPLGLGIVMLVAPAVAIVYLWRARPKRRV